MLKRSLDYVNEADPNVKYYVYFEGVGNLTKSAIVDTAYIRGYDNGVLVNEIDLVQAGSVLFTAVVHAIELHLCVANTSAPKSHMPEWF